MTTAPRIGDRFSLVVCDEVTRTQIIQYAATSGDLSPLHVDEPAARAAGQPGIMAHGMLTMALSVRAVTTWFGREALRSVTVRFTAPVWPGDRLTTDGVVESLTNGVDGGTTVRLALTTRTQSDTVVLSGSAAVTIDSDSNAK